jgi:hypothetical protein
MEKLPTSVIVAQYLAELDKQNSIRTNGLVRMLLLNHVKNIVLRILLDSYSGKHTVILLYIVQIC